MESRLALRSTASAGLGATRVNSIAADLRLVRVQTRNAGKNTPIAPGRWLRLASGRLERRSGDLKPHPRLASKSSQLASRLSLLTVQIPVQNACAAHQNCSCS